MAQLQWALAPALGTTLTLLWLYSSSGGVSDSPARWVAVISLPALISAYGMTRKSLDFSGGMLAVLVGFVLTAASGCFVVALLVFFFSSSRLTKWKGSEKRKFEADYKEGGQRNWLQVICNGGPACVAALLYLKAAGMVETPLHFSLAGYNWSTVYSLACLAAICCSCGDTWASEVGSVLGGVPRLITTWRKVPRGTNGGVTLVGTLCSLAGGLAVGLGYFVTLAVFNLWYGLVHSEGMSLWSQLPVLGVAAFAGLFGSFVDSVLGATVQFSGSNEKLGKIVNKPSDGVTHISGVDLLDNHIVNLFSSLITAIVTPCVVWNILYVLEA